MQFFMYRLLPLILNMSLTASVVILAVLLARLILKRAPRRYSYALWAVVLFRLLCPASFSSALSLLSLASAPAGAAAGEVSMVDYIPMDVVHNAASAVELPFGVFNDAVNSALPQGAEQTGADPLEAPVCFLTILWCLVAAGMLFAGLVKYIDLRLRLWDSQKLEGRVRSSKYISTAFAAGIFRPRIYLPERLTERERDCVLAHERSHIRRGDHIIKPLAYLALCVHWFNPLVWLASSAAAPAGTVQGSPAPTEAALLPETGGAEGACVGAGVGVGVGTGVGVGSAVGDGSAEGCVTEGVGMGVSACGRPQAEREAVSAAARRSGAMFRISFFKVYSSGVSFLSPEATRKGLSPRASSASAASPAEAYSPMATM